MAQPYESDLTRMIRELLQEKPHIVQEQKKGRALWWDRKLDLEDLKRTGESNVKQQATSIKTRSDSRLRRSLPPLRSVSRFAAVPHPRFRLQHGTPAAPADPLLASALVGRGTASMSGSVLPELDQKRDWDGLLRYAEERQRRDPEGSDWGGRRLRLGAPRRLSEGDLGALPGYPTQPEDVGAWNLLGESQRRAGQPGQAIRTLERASAIGRTSFVTFFFLGEAYPRRQSTRPRNECVPGGRAP